MDGSILFTSRVLTIEFVSINTLSPLADVYSKVYGYTDYMVMGSGEELGRSELSKLKSERCVDCSISNAVRRGKLRVPLCALGSVRVLAHVASQRERMGRRELICSRAPAADPMASWSGD